MFSLNLYGYNFKKIDSTYQNVDFLFNLEKIPKGSKQALAFRG